MDRPPRIVRCPKCLALLQEPPPGTPLYKCGNCSTVLRAKHASSDANSGKRLINRAHQNNGATPVDHVTNRTYSNDGTQSPVFHGPFGPKAGGDAVKHANTEDDRRSGHSQHGPTAVGLLPGTLDTFSDQRNLIDSERVNSAGQSRPGTPSQAQLYSNPSPVERFTNEATRDDNTDFLKAPAELITSNIDGTASLNNGHKLSPLDSSGDGACIVERQSDDNSEDESPPFSPTKALAARRAAGPLYKAREKPKLEQTSSSSSRSGSSRKSRGRLYKGRSLAHDSVEVLGSQASDRALESNLDGPQQGALGPDPSLHKYGDQKQSMHRQRHSEESLGVYERSLGRDLYGGHPEHETRLSTDNVTQGQDRSSDEDNTSLRPGVRQDVERTGKQGLVEKSVEAHGKEVSTGHSDKDRQAKQAGKVPEEVLSNKPVGGVSFGKWGQQNAITAKGQHEEEPIVNKYTSTEDDRDPADLLGEQALSVFTNSRPTGRKKLSPLARLNLTPPSSSVTGNSWSNTGRVQSSPEQLSTAQANLESNAESPPTMQDIYGPPDVLNYDTSEDSYDADCDQGLVHSNSQRQCEELEFPSVDQGGHIGEISSKPELSSADLQFKEDDEFNQLALDKTRQNASSLGQLEVTLPSSPNKLDSSPQPFPELTQSADSSKAHTSDHHSELQEKSPVLQSHAPESSGNGGQLQGSDYASADVQTQILRLQINTPIPERTHVRCRHCRLHLQVPLDLPPSQTGVQKLRCGACWKISRFRLNQVLSPGGVSSPAASDVSLGCSFQDGPKSPRDLSGSGKCSTRNNNRGTGLHDRVLNRSMSGGMNPKSPSAKQSSRAAAASKLSNITTFANVAPETFEGSTPVTSGELGPAHNSLQGVKDFGEISPMGEEEPTYASHSPALSNASQDTSADRMQKPLPDRKVLVTSSDSDDEKPSASLDVGAAGPSAVRKITWSASDPPEFEDGHEFKGLRGFLKKSVKELTKGKKSNQFRRKVVVNGHPVPDDVVKRAEDYAGPIHPGSYWYDIRAGFWGVMGGPCLGMIPPFIEELNYTLARHCSHGKTGVIVNGRELHHKDLELLKRRGLPGAPGKAYNVDIDGRVVEVATGNELKGLGRLAPTLEATGKGPGMWVPEGK